MQQEWSHPTLIQNLHVSCWKRSFLLLCPLQQSLRGYCQDFHMSQNPYHWQQWFLLCFHVYNCECAKAWVLTSINICTCIKHKSILQYWGWQASGTWEHVWSQVRSIKNLIWSASRNISKHKAQSNHIFYLHNLDELYSTENWSMCHEVVCTNDPKKDINNDMCLSVECTPVPGTVVRSPSSEYLYDVIKDGVLQYFVHWHTATYDGWRMAYRVPLWLRRLRTGSTSMFILVYLCIGTISGRCKQPCSEC